MLCISCDKVAFHLPVKANFIANHSLRELFASLFDRNSNCHGHTNHGVVTCADQTHHLNVKMTAVEEYAFIVKKK